MSLPCYTKKFVEEYEGIKIFEIQYDSKWGPKTVYSLGEGGVDDLCDTFEMSYVETINLAKVHGCITQREYIDGNVSSPHMDFETLDGMKHMIDVGKSARIMANIAGNFTEEEMDEKIERIKKGL